MKLLFAAAELAPLAQTGGLGEAVSGLARALAERGHEVRCALPAYRTALAHPDCPPLADGPEVALWTPNGVEHGRWRRGPLGPGLELLALDVPALFDRAGIYGEGGFGYWDEGWRYAAFARATAELCDRDPPDVLVAHDWHAALAPALVRTRYGSGPASASRLVLVVHNNRFQGRYPRELLPWTGLPADLFHPGGVEFYGDVSLLKAGLLFADRIVAVSPTYARDLTTYEGGDGLDGVYRMRSDRLTGIANGIDVERFDPATDRALPARYDAARPQGKGRCRSALVAELGLESPPRGRLLAAIGRLSLQKGWDVVTAAVDGLVAGGASLVLLGDGEPAIAAALHHAAERHPARVHFRAGWDDALARRAYAAADCVLVPSRFEPCGLVQLIAQRYGSLPVARRTGGLADTIADGATGIHFDDVSADALIGGVERGAALAARRGIARELMRIDVSWRGPAERYEEIFRSLA